MAQFIKVQKTNNLKTFINLDNVLHIANEGGSTCRVYFLDGSVIDIKQNFDTLVSSNRSVIPMFENK